MSIREMGRGGAVGARYGEVTAVTLEWTARQAVGLVLFIFSPHTSPEMPDQISLFLHFFSQLPDP